MAGTRRLYLGVDGGQSSTRGVIGDDTGRVLARAAGAPCHRATSDEGAAKLRQAAGDLVQALLAAAGLAADTPFAAACFGMSGGPADKREILAGLVPSAAVEVTTDAAAALEAAAGSGPGAIVVAGTGSIALARDEAGNTVRCGGWGYVFGDDGSAFDIARRALRAVLAADEGWGARTRLRETILGATGCASVHDALHRFYDPDWPRNRVAALAPLVDAAARDGDEPARIVLREAGHALGTLAVRARDSLASPPLDPAVFASGGAFRSERVMKAFAARLRSDGLAPKQPPRDAAVGALLRAYRLQGVDVPLAEAD